MNRKYLNALYTMTITTVVFISQSVIASPHENFIRERMKDRLTEVVELKIEGIFIEGDDGYLHVVPNKKVSGSVERLMTMENIDRKEVYRTIGLKATPIMIAGEVGKMRAELRKNN